MNTRKITFTNASGMKLAARLELPDDERPVAYAIFAHCFTCSKNIKAAVNITRAMSSRRIAVLRFDFTGLGESEGDFADTTFSSQVSDLVAAARFLEREYEAPRLLVGHSLGGSAVLVAAGALPSATAVATIAAPYSPSHLRRLLGKSAEQAERQGEATVNLGGSNFTIRKSLLDDLEAQRPAETLANLQGALLVLHSPADTIVKIDNATQIFQAAHQPKSFVSLGSADHLMSEAADSRYAGEVIASWATRYLDGAEAQPMAQRQFLAADNRVTARTGPEGFRTEIFANGFSLTADEPVSYGGSNEGPSPYEFVMAGLAACTSMTVQMYARRKGWPLVDALVRLSHHKIHAEDCRDCESQDRRIDKFVRELELIGELDQEQRQKLLEIAEKCPVHRTLTSEILVETRLKESMVEQ
ncbi:bifunctional alpha/beta hydrolase/OsmC family protein [Geomonas paludis]|uniref:Bifunctional alpha/beta hydrolase/OsmC family protein n=1 Tax=Geomonas paludis TaxID=2740185 RepID=A0A6V8N0J0_9BACT|nr:bifunctional alpha/beta hydrolase/OsmC family protein [Geomonas paludis]UPU36557.1 bifunctional alpha/beta hydrolase/OsmC family protein [Geomonas paludis]GFO65263.1 osmotically inducible protein C [Geomonas paludis]